jgi:transposase-like protein
MAWSKCPHCGGSSFELTEVSPSGGSFKQNFVQCSSCGAPFGVVDYYNVGQLLKEQEQAIKTISRRLATVEAYLADVSQKLRRH